MLKIKYFAEKLILTLSYSKIVLNSMRLVTKWRPEMIQWNNYSKTLKCFTLFSIIYRLDIITEDFSSQQNFWRWQLSLNRNNEKGSWTEPGSVSRIPPGRERVAWNEASPSRTSYRGFRFITSNREWMEGGW